MTFKLPELNYNYDQLEPHIDARTMEIHHTKHHQAYINNLNAALEGHENLKSKSIEEIISDLESVPENIRTAVRNNGGGHLNHSMFWELMSPNGGGEPKGELGKLIDRDFGNLDTFKAEFKKAAMGRFGSGWAWLVLDGEKLKVVSTPNQDNPISEGLKPILGIDVWEHAYYLKYQNRRPEYLGAIWNVINWNKVGERFENASK